MEPTSLSLLNRLRVAAPDAPDWRRLHNIYFPLIQAWLRRVPGIDNDADDLAQEVLIILVRELPKFDRRRDGAFRAWLRQITVNRVRTLRKARARLPKVGGGDEVDAHLDQLKDSTSNLSAQWDQEHDHHVMQKLLAIVQPDFDAKTWLAFTRFALDGAAAAEVAQELSMTVNAVVLAKFRVLKRLREEAGELTD